MNWKMSDIIGKGLTVTGGAGKLISSQSERKTEYIFELAPMFAPRMTRADAYKKRPVVLRYRAFDDELNRQANAMKFVLGDTLDVTFIVPLPESWSKKKQLEHDGKPCMKKPDLDNYVKGFLDCLSSQDSNVWKINAQKIYGAVGKIIVKSIQNES